MFFKWEWEKEPNNICCCFLNWQADKHHKANRLLSLSQWNEERTGKKWKVELMGRDKNYSLRKERRIVVIITIYKHIYIYKTSKAQFNRSPPAVWCPTSLQAAAAPWPAPHSFVPFCMRSMGMESPRAHCPGSAVPPEQLPAGGRSACRHHSTPMSMHPMSAYWATSSAWAAGMHGTEQGAYMEDGGVAYGGHGSNSLAAQCDPPGHH